MAADPHMLLAAASLVPGLGSLAAAMDMALYLYEGDSFNAALAAAALIPGGAMLAIGVGKGARALFNLARSGAKDLGAAVKASRIFRGLAGGARAVSRVVGSVRTRISKWVGKADEVAKAGAASTRSPSRILSQNITKATGVKQAAGEAAHHIVAYGSKKAADARDILKKWEIDINSADNGVFLPEPYHWRVHTDAYYQAVARSLRGAASRDEALEVLNDFRTRLQAGTTKW